MLVAMSYRIVVVGRESAYGAVELKLRNSVWATTTMNTITTQ